MLSTYALSSEVTNVRNVSAPLDGRRSRSLVLAPVSCRLEIIDADNDDGGNQIIDLAKRPDRRYETHQHFGVKHVDDVILFRRPIAIRKKDVNGAVFSEDARMYRVRDPLFRSRRSLRCCGVAGGDEEADGNEVGASHWRNLTARENASRTYSTRPQPCGPETKADYSRRLPQSITHEKGGIEWTKFSDGSWCPAGLLR